MKATVASAVLVAMVLAGCNDSGGPEQPAPIVVGSIRGFVVDEALRGINAANVTLGGNQSTTTDPTGAFVFGNLTPGTYVVAADAATYLGRQTTVDVAAGNATDVRLVLPVNASALAFHQTFTFKGFVDAHGGSNAPEVGECQCDFTVPTEGTWLTIIVEAEWEDSVSPVAFETEYAWRVGTASASVNGTGPSPLLGRIEAGMLEPADSVEVRVAPHSDWLFTNQQFDVLVTVWYGEPAPTDFAGLGG